MKAPNQPISQQTTSPAGRNRQFFSYSALAAAVALSLGGITAIAKTSATLPESAPLTTEQSAVRAPASFASLVQAVQPAVVSITVDGMAMAMAGEKIPDLASPDDPQFKEFFDRFFRHSPKLPGGQGQGLRVQGVGSGFIVTADGHIVTSNHVIENASEIHVVLNDGQRLPAEVLGRDPKTDLALLKIDAGSDLPYVAFGDSNNTRPGDWVVAIGNPFGLGGTATTGIISARGRDIHSGPYDDYLQIDAPINRGNSGGPLFDLSGRVIGVNTAIYSPNGTNVGIGFAVPAEQAKSVISQLMQTGHVQRGWLGVQIQGLTEALAESVKLPDTKGALVADVIAESPAAQAGIRIGDVILAFNDQEIGAMRDLPRLVANVTPGEKPSVTVWRQGEKRNLRVSITAVPDKALAATKVTPQPAEGVRLGVVLAPITDELRQRLDVAEGVEGALVVEVESGSPAAREGLRPGDVIVQAGEKPVFTPDDVVGVVQAANAGDRNRLLLLINRQGNQRFVTVQLG